MFKRTQHSIANMFFIPLAMLLQASGQFDPNVAPITWLGFLSNMVPVVLGNILGGSVLVGLVYYIVYLRKPIADT